MAQYYSGSTAAAAMAPVGVPVARTAVMQPFDLPSSTGFISNSYTPLAFTGNLTQGQDFQSPARPNVPWTPNYGIAQPWGQGPMTDVDDPQCRMMAYPSHCSVSKALTYTPYPDVASGVSMYPYGGNASVQLVDGNPAALGNPGFFLPVTDYADEGARAAGDPSTHNYGNVTSYEDLVTARKDGPLSGPCAPYFYCDGPAAPSMVGYTSASADAVVTTCPTSYLKTTQFPDRVALTSSGFMKPNQTYMIANYDVEGTLSFFVSGKYYSLAKGQSVYVPPIVSDVRAAQLGSGVVLTLPSFTNHAESVTSGGLKLMSTLRWMDKSTQLIKYAVANASTQSQAQPTTNATLAQTLQGETGYADQEFFNDTNRDVQFSVVNYNGSLGAPVVTVKPNQTSPIRSTWNMKSVKVSDGFVTLVLPKFSYESGSQETKDRDLTFLSGKYPNGITRYTVFQTVLGVRPPYTNLPSAPTNLQYAPTNVPYAPKATPTAGALAATPNNARGFMNQVFKNNTNQDVWLSIDDNGALGVRVPAYGSYPIRTTIMYSVTVSDGKDMLQLPAYDGRVGNQTVSNDTLTLWSSSVYDGTRTYTLTERPQRMLKAGGIPPMVGSDESQTRVGPDGKQRMLKAGGIPPMVGPDGTRTIYGPGGIQTRPEPGGIQTAETPRSGKMDAYTPVKSLLAVAGRSKGASCCPDGSCSIAGMMGCFTTKSVIDAGYTCETPTCQETCYTEEALRAHGLKYVLIDGGSPAGSGGGGSSAGSGGGGSSAGSNGDGSLPACDADSCRLSGLDQCFTKDSLQKSNLKCGDPYISPDANANTPADSGFQGNSNCSDSCISSYGLCDYYPQCPQIGEYAPGLDKNVTCDDVCKMLPSGLHERCMNLCNCCANKAREAGGGDSVPGPK